MIQQSRLEFRQGLIFPFFFLSFFSIERYRLDVSSISRASRNINPAKIRKSLCTGSNTPDLSARTKTVINKERPLPVAASVEKRLSYSSTIAPCGQTLAHVPQLMHVSGSIE